MMNLTGKLRDPVYVPLLFGLTPPAVETEEDKRLRINRRRSRRLQPLSLDGLCLYDVQDESVRMREERPYEARRFMDPLAYRRSLANVCSLESVQYCAVGRFSASQLSQRIHDIGPEPVVFVGKPASDAPALTSLEESYRIHAEIQDSPLLGAVCIPERQYHGYPETKRMLRKISQGVGFFITQCIYDIDTVEKMLFEYASGCSHLGITPKKILFTLSPAGSKKSVSFFRWLGIHVPEQVEKRILDVKDPLSESRIVLEAFSDRISRLCMKLGIPFGFNVESIISKKEEFMTALELARGLIRRNSSGKEVLIMHVGNAD